MSRVVMSAIVVLAAFSANAQIQPPVRVGAVVTDPSMTVTDRGALLEIFPSRRAIAQLDATSHRMTRRVTTTSATAAIDSSHMGVVFNHAMQQQGYISGEIAFKVKHDQQFSQVSSNYPGLRRVVPPSVYVVNARTPAEFLKILKDLKKRTDLDWVEPTVSYQGSP